MLTGSELTVDAALPAGADGVVPGVGNVDPAGVFLQIQLSDESVALIAERLRSAGLPPVR